MKHLLTCVLAVALGAIGFNCDTGQDGPPPGCEGVITFPDGSLEAAIRDEIDLATGDIYYSDVAEVEEILALSSDISDLTNIHCLDSLTGLWLADSQVSDISPISTLTSLTGLGLSGNQVSDITPLSNLTSLTKLELGRNQVGDIGPLGSLTSLTQLYLNEIQISDIGPLSSLVNLRTVYLSDNQISDIGPLVDNAGIDDGDYVEMGQNLLECDQEDLDDIAELEERGVNLGHDC